MQSVVLGMKGSCTDEWQAGSTCNRSISKEAARCEGTGMLSRGAAVSGSVALRAAAAAAVAAAAAAAAVAAAVAAAALGRDWPPSCGRKRADDGVEEAIGGVAAAKDGGLPTETSPRKPTSTKKQHRG